MELQSMLKIVFGAILIITYLALFYYAYDTFEIYKDVNVVNKDEHKVFKSTIENDKPISSKEDVVESKDEIHKKQEYELVSLGEFKLTSYCPCKICCNEFAYNRPIDENGNEIVYGAIGEQLKEGYSIAVDPKVIPYGTEVIINGHTYKAQDCGGAIKGNRIDVYMSNHEEAKKFGVQYAEVFVKNE